MNPVSLIYLKLFRIFTDTIKKCMNIITDEDVSTLRQELFIEFYSQFSVERLEEMGKTVVSNDTVAINLRKR